MNNTERIDRLEKQMRVVLGNKICIMCNELATHEFVSSKDPSSTPMSVCIKHWTDFTLFDKKENTKEKVKKYLKDNKIYALDPENPDYEDNYRQCVANLAETYMDISTCLSCFYPVNRGYCCTNCGSVDPSDPAGVLPDEV